MADEAVRRGLGLRPSACRALFVCNGQPSVADGIWTATPASSEGGSARNRLGRFIHQSAGERAGDGTEDAGQPGANGRAVWGQGDGGQRRPLIGRRRTCYSHENNQFRRLHGARRSSGSEQ